MEANAGEKEKSRKAGRNVFLSLLVFFLMVAGINAFFIYKAVRTHTGTIVDNPYERGLGYNRTLAAAAAQEGFDWRVAAELKKISALEYDIFFAATGRTGQPVAVDSFEMKILRPVDAREDISPVFSADGNGKYVSRVVFPGPGRWEIRGRVVRGEENFYLTKPLVVE